jgi:hypothetical protein
MDRTFRRWRSGSTTLAIVLFPARYPRVHGIYGNVSNQEQISYFATIGEANSTPAASTNSFKDSASSYYPLASRWDVR